MSWHCFWNCTPSHNCNWNWIDCNINWYIDLAFNLICLIEFFQQSLAIKLQPPLPFNDYFQILILPSSLLALATFSFVHEHLSSAALKTDAPKISFLITKWSAGVFVVSRYASEAAWGGTKTWTVRSSAILDVIYEGWRDAIDRIDVQTQCFWLRDEPKHFTFMCRSISTELYKTFLSVWFVNVLNHVQ